MSKLSDKVAYLRGLAEGMRVDRDTNEGRLLLEVIATLSEVAEKLDELDENVAELGDYVECIDDDLEALEVRADEEDAEEDDDEDDEFDGDEDDDEDFAFVSSDEDDDEDSCSCGCAHCADDCDCGEEEDDEIGMYSGCLCSECGGMFSVDVNHDEEQLFVCPHCGKKVKAVRMNCNNVPVAQTVPEDEE